MRLFFSTNSYHCHFVNGLSPLATRDLFSHCWQKLVVSDFSPFFNTTDAKCQKLMVFSASIVSPKQGLWRNADRARYETYFFSFLLTQFHCFSHIILSVFGFHPNHFAFRALHLFTFFSWRFAFPSGIFRLSPLMATFTIRVHRGPSTSLHKTMVSGVSVSPSGASTRLLLFPPWHSTKPHSSPARPASSSETPDLSLPKKSTADDLHVSKERRSCKSASFLVPLDFPDLCSLLA